LDFNTAQRERVTHLHIYGRPGVGKSRLALELCRDAPWRSSVIYVPQARDVKVTELLEGVAQSPGKRLVLVVDEAPSSILGRLSAAAHYAEERIRLITIGHEGSTDHAHMRELKVEPLAPKEMAQVVESIDQGLPREQVEFIVAFADGYVKLAQLATNAMSKIQNINAVVS
jgi:hypothetical protein